MKTEILIREANPTDIPRLMFLVRELAVFERCPDEVLNTEAQMLADGFGGAPAFKALVAECEGEVRGMAVYFYSYSTWKGKCIYIDDIVVQEGFRMRGIGTALMDKLVQVAKTEQVGKLHWQVLDWNEAAIRFYQKYQASFDGEWINCAIPKIKLQSL